MTETEERQRVIAEARSWLGTPFQHMGRIKGRRGGVDCGQFLLGVFENAGAMPHFEPTPYSMQHMLHSREEWYLRDIMKFASEILELEAQPGDIVIYRVGLTYSHAGILIETWPGHIIHAVNGAGVIISHGTKQGNLKGRRERKFFTRWPQEQKKFLIRNSHPESGLDRALVARQ
jgi:cell wall-associated NlpC family hydrolase